MRQVDILVRSTPELDRPALVGIDGVDGSGKTTFAARLAGRYSELGRRAHVVHMDDFLNPRATRHRLGRSSPEGFFRDSYNLPVFTSTVLEPLRRTGRTGRTQIVARAFDHRTDQPVHEEPTAVAAADVVIVEGLFLHRDELVGAWDMSVFLDVPFAISVARMAGRDGTSPDPADGSVRRYVEGQRIYLAACDPRRRATHSFANY